MTHSDDYAALRDSFAEGLVAGGISDEPQATSDARHLIGWLHAEGYTVTKATEPGSSTASTNETENNR